MLGTSDPYSIPKSNPFTKEAGVSNLLDDTHWAVAVSVLAVGISFSVMALWGTLSAPYPQNPGYY
jgi:hypothetical protein